MRASRGKRESTGERGVGVHWVADVLWSVFTKTEPLTRFRKHVVIALIAAGLLISALLALIPLFKSDPPPVPKPIILQDGGIHIGDNVVGEQTKIVTPAPNEIQ